jgi:hypothetical protein
MMDSGELDTFEVEESGGASTPRYSERSRAVALVLGGVGGFLGLHRFYAGRNQSGVLMILTLGGGAIWWLYDLVLLVAGEFRDAEGRMIRHWDVQEPLTGPPSESRGMEQLANRIDRLQRDVNEPAERLDFAERLLAEHRGPDRLASG